MATTQGTLVWEEFLKACSALEILSKDLEQDWKVERNSDQIGESYLKHTCVRRLSDLVEVDSSTKSATEESSFAACELSQDSAETELESTYCKTDYLVKCEYHIVYSVSYSVPVLYFNISHATPCHVSMSIRRDRNGSSIMDDLPARWPEYKYALRYRQTYTETLGGYPKLFPLVGYSRSTGGSLLTLDEVWSMFRGKKGLITDEDMWSTLSQQDHPVLNLPFFTIHPCHTSRLMGTLWSKPQDPPLSYLITWLSIMGGRLGLKIPNELGLYLASPDQPVENLEA